MLRIAYFSPLPPQRTGIADYSAELLPYLAELAEVTLYVPDPSSVSTWLRRCFPVFDHADFPRRRWSHDVTLYHVGNSVFHCPIYEMLQRYPSVTVLHDYGLHHFLLENTLGEGDFPAYVRELAYARGRSGQARAHAIRRGEEPFPLYDWPLSRRVIDLSLGIVVHSDAGRHRVRATRPESCVAHIHHLLPLPVPRDRESVRARLDLPADAFVVVTAGLMTPEKCPGVVMETFRRFRRQHPQARWLIVGRTLEGFVEWEQEADLGDAVRHLGYVEGLAAFYDALAAADVCLNLRHPTAGETSGAVLRAMAVGLPVVVSNQGWYAELPEDCCLKVKHDGSEADQVLRILEELIGQPEARAEMGRRAREYVAQACDPRHVAQDYVDFLRSVLISIGEDGACTSST